MNLTKYQQLWLENEANKYIVAKLNRRIDELSSSYDKHHNKIKELETLEKFVFFKRKIRNEINQLEIKKNIILIESDNLKCILNDNGLLYETKRYYYLREHALEIYCPCNKDSVKVND